MKLTASEKASLLKLGIDALHKCNICGKVCNMLLTYFGRDETTDHYCSYECYRKGEIMIQKTKTTKTTAAAAPEPVASAAPADPTPAPAAAKGNKKKLKAKGKTKPAAPAAAPAAAPDKDKSTVKFAEGSIGAKIWEALKTGPQTLEEVRALGAADPRRRCSTMNERLVKHNSRYRIVYAGGQFKRVKEAKPSV